MKKYRKKNLSFLLKNSGPMSKKKYYKKFHTQVIALSELYKTFQSIIY